MGLLIMSLSSEGAFIVDLISNTVFPIGACVAMGLYVKYNSDKHREERYAITESHEKEVEKLSSVLNNNTVAITKLCEKLDNIKLKGD